MGAIPATTGNFRWSPRDTSAEEMSKKIDELQKTVEELKEIIKNRRSQ